MAEDRADDDDHPTPDQLDAFGRGAIDDSLAEAIEHHLVRCAACLGRLEEARPDDPWLALLRVVGPPSSGRDDLEAALPSGYELEAVIGRGGMGVVHRARQLGLDRRVALKMIAAGRDASPMLIERFRREVEAAASLNHPAIVPIHDVGVRDGVPFFAMELLEGGSLADRLAAGPLRAPEAVALVDRLARAVDHAHRQGVIHRDLKPSNILFDAAGAAKVADFGLAKRLDSDPGGLTTRSGAILGTPSSMAPEQAAGPPGEVGPAADVHALGVILFECLTGRPPFLGAGPLETLELIRQAEAPNPCRFREGIPADLGTICLTCLEKDPARRYGSAAALADDLGRFSRGESILARPAGRLRRLGKWARRRPFEAAFALLLATSLVGTIAGLLAHQARLREAIGREAEAAREARRQRLLAETNYREARDAITRILATLGDPRFVGTPRLAEVHRAQAEAALAFYDRVLRQAGPADPVIRLDTARAAVEAANLQITIGRPEPAEANLLRAIGLLDALLAERPDDPALLKDQMIARIKLGVLLMGGDTGRSVEALERALALARRRAEVRPNDGEPPEKDLAWCEHNLGSAWQIAGQHDRAIPHYVRSVSYYEGLLGRLPDDVARRVELAQSLVNLGLARSVVGDREAAAADYRRAGSLLDGALTDRPDVAEFRATRCDLLVNWGNLDVADGRLDEGVARYDDGIRMIRPLLDAEPNVPRLRSTGLNLHGARALALDRSGRPLEAAEDWDRVIELAGPGPAALGHRISRLLSLARGGDSRSVSAEAAPLEERADLAAADAYNLACALAIASAADDDPDRSPLRDRALTLVDRALDASPGLRDLARDDPDLRPLADEPAFLRALAGP